MKNSLQVCSASKPCESKTKRVLLMIVCGAVIGLVNGFFGGGGGMICVPLLEHVLGLDGRAAHSTAIAVIFPISFASAIIYGVNGHVDVSLFLSVGSGVFIGGIIGSFLLKILPIKIIKIIFTFLVLFGGIRLLF